jgi:hypothetical protein
MLLKLETIYYQCLPCFGRWERQLAGAVIIDYLPDLCTWLKLFASKEISTGNGFEKAELSWVFNRSLLVCLLKLVVCFMDLEENTACRPVRSDSPLTLKGGIKRKRPSINENMTVHYRPY